MKKRIFLMMVLLSTTILTAQQTKSEVEAIKKAVQTSYVEGLQNEGLAEKIDLGFHPDFRLLGIGNNGEMWILPISDWKRNAVNNRNNGKLPRKHDNVYRVDFDLIDVTGNAAMVKLYGYNGTKLVYVDYISMYKFKDGWKLVNKIFQKM